jgi:hypothetical protein
MNEDQWLSGTDPAAMLEYLRNGGNGSERKLRLFACACCRGVWRLMADKCSRRAVEVAERFADGQATPQTLLKWHWAAYEAYETTDGAGRVEAAYAASRAAHQDAALAALDASAAAGDAGLAPPGRCDLLRDVVANPFRVAPAIDQVWLCWNDGTIPRLAWASYEERSLPSGLLDTARLAVLADAMEEAGCTDADLLGHLRGPGPHVRGCWAVDLLLAKS